MEPKLEIEAGSSIAYHTGDWRSQQPVYQNKWPPCSQVCPASEDIQAWLALAAQQQWQAAWEKLTERNPFPATMGRICYHACESPCNRKHLDSAVNIHAMERYLGDMAIAQGWRHASVSEQSVVQGMVQRTAQGVAIVGAGPAGLSCAFQLARRGYPVTIFDAQSEPGGTLRSAIPDYRLPKQILAKEIDAILALGIELRLNSRVNERDLQDQFAAVFLAIGTQQPRRFQFANNANTGESHHRVMTGIEFLQALNRGEKISLPKQVAVVGGGNTAIDVARCVRRLGAQASVICAQDPHGAHHRELGTEMPASLVEVIEAETEGVEFIYRAGVQGLVRSGEHLSGIEIAHVDQVHDRHGHFNPKFFAGTEEFIPAGLVIFAIGQKTDWQGLEKFEYATETDGVWIGGDAANKSKVAAAAVGSGYQAAMSIIASMQNEAFVFAEHKKSKITFRQMQLHYYQQQSRHEGEKNPERLSSFTEVVAGLLDDDAVDEAKRCLSCGVCFECDNCWHFCPDAAVIKKAGGYTIDYDYCKGCGICAQECPCGHIDMEKV